MSYPRWIFVLIPLLVAIHLNYWMWDDTRLLLGFPVNLLYHLLFSLFLCLVMLVLVRRGWPGYLDEE